MDPYIRKWAGILLLAATVLVYGAVQGVLFEATIFLTIAAVMIFAYVTFKPGLWALIVWATIAYAVYSFFKMGWPTAGYSIILVLVATAAWLFFSPATATTEKSMRISEKPLQPPPKQAVPEPPPKPVLTDPPPAPKPAAPEPPPAPPTQKERKPRAQTGTTGTKPPKKRTPPKIDN